MVAKKYLHILFFVTLMVLKVSAIAIYLHHDTCEQVDDCEICEHAIYNQSNEFSNPPHFQAIEVSQSPSLWQPKSRYKSVSIPTLSNNTHFARPPPTSCI